MGLLTLLFQLNAKYWKVFKASPTHRHTWGLLTLLVQPNTKYRKVFQAGPDNTQAHKGFANAASPTKRKILKGVQSWSDTQAHMVC